MSVVSAKGNEFVQWVKMIEGRGHVTKAVRKSICKKFEKILNDGSLNKKQKESAFFSWVDRVVVKKTITTGNAHFIKKKIEAIFPKSQKKVATNNYAPNRQGVIDWINRNKKEFNNDTKKIGHIIAKFEKCFPKNGSQNIAKSLKEYNNYIDRIVQERHITAGNAKYMKAKLNALFMQNTSLQNSRSSTFVAFYDHTDPKTECFGNFYMSPITYNGLTFRCAEAAFQAQKFTYDPALMKKFCTVDGDGAFRLARANKAQVNWMQNNTNVNEMRAILQEKFKDPNLRKKLLATGNQYLVEHIPVKGRDKFWGDDNDGTGANKLGELLMAERARLGGTGVVPATKEYKKFVQ